MSRRIRRKPSRYFMAFLILIICAGNGAGAQSPAAKVIPTIVFMTDFGTIDDSVAICRGVMYSIAPDVRIVDLTHQVTPFSILDGARFLYGAAPYYPAGTVFVVVVDPTVGSTRKAVVVRSKRGQYFVLARQRFDDAGAGSRRNRRCAGDHESRLDDWSGAVVDFSWTRHIFTGRGASGARRRLGRRGT